jgi:conjugal transfer mating pair stabilization protein TraG
MMSGASSSVDPSRLRPDAYQSTPAMTLGSQTEASPNTGTKQSGMADTSISSSSTIGKGVQSAATSASSARASANETLSKINQLSSRNGTTSSISNSITSGVNQVLSSGKSWTTSDGRTINDSQTLSEGETEAVNAAVNAALNVGGGNESNNDNDSDGRKKIGSLIKAGVSASLDSIAGTSAERKAMIADLASQVFTKSNAYNELTNSTSGSSTTSSNQSFQSTEEMEALGKQYQSQLDAVEQAEKKYAEMASIQDSNTKSLNMPTWQLGPALNKAGALADISNANRALEEKMGSQEYAKLSNDAQYEINNSSASGLVGADREALAGFLKLNREDPVAAAKIFNDYLLPTSSESGADISPTEFKNNSKSVDDIVSNDMAENFRSKAKGDASDQNSDVDGESRSGHASALKQSVSHSAPHQEHASKSTEKVSHKPTSPKPATLSATGSSPKNKVEGMLKNIDPNEVRNRIETGPHLSPEKINGTEMSKHALSNFTDASTDVVVDAVTTSREAIESFQDDLTAYGKLSLDNLKRDLGIKDKKPSSSDEPRAPSDNDLPPLPQK